MPLALRKLRHALLSFRVFANQGFPFGVELGITEVFTVGVDREPNAASPEPDPRSIVFVVVHAEADDVRDRVEVADC